MSEELAVIIVVSVLGGTAFLLSPVMIVRMVLKHREKLAAIQNRQDGAPGLLEAIADLRREMATLRDTTTKFDMSFDAALARVEDRLCRLEGEQAAAVTRPAASYTPSYAAPAEEPASAAVLGRR